VSTKHMMSMMDTTRNPASTTALATSVASGFPTAAELILSELRGAIADIDPATLREAVTLLLGAGRIFAAAAGRSRLALGMGAMRLAHLGFAVYIAGDITTPPIARGDVLLVASGSGETCNVIHAADVANKAGALVIALTAARESTLAKSARVVLWLNAPGKLERSSAGSKQYAGSLFEQAVMLTLDSLFHALWQASELDASALWSRHANIE
jgi:6-phospho-3-hexuloisomerase